jgi:hypothetical protein
MRKRSRKPRLPDAAEAAFRIVQAISGESSAEPPTEGEKNPAAVALGRLGGLKGGKARAAKMTKKQRSESAKKAAMARWKQATKSATRAASPRHS